MFDQLMAPFDLPRQAAYNLVRGAGRFATGQGAERDLAQMAPGGIGALMAALLGPGAGLLAAGGAQGLGMAADPDAFRAADPSDLVAGLKDMGVPGADPNSMWQTGLAQVATDPLMQYGAYGAIKNWPRGMPRAAEPPMSQSMRPGPNPNALYLGEEQQMLQNAMERGWAGQGQGTGGVPPVPPGVGPQAGQVQMGGVPPYDPMAMIQADATSSAASEAAGLANQAADVRLNKLKAEPSDLDARQLRLHNRSLLAQQQNAMNVDEGRLTGRMDSLSKIYPDMLQDAGEPGMAPGQALLERLGLADEMRSVNTTRGAMRRRAIGNPFGGPINEYNMAPEHQNVIHDAMRDSQVMDHLGQQGMLSMPDEALTQYYTAANKLPTELGEMANPMMDQLGMLQEGQMGRGQVSELMRALQGRGIPVNQEMMMQRGMQQRLETASENLFSGSITPDAMAQKLTSMGIPQQAIPGLTREFSTMAQEVEQMSLLATSEAENDAFSEYMYSQIQKGSKLLQPYMWG